MVKSAELLFDRRDSDLSTKAYSFTAHLSSVFWRDGLANPLPDRLRIAQSPESKDLFSTRRDHNGGNSQQRSDQALPEEHIVDVPQRHRFNLVTGVAVSQDEAVACQFVVHPSPDKRRRAE